MGINVKLASAGRGSGGGTLNIYGPKHRDVVENNAPRAAEIVTRWLGPRWRPIAVALRGAAQPACRRWLQYRAMPAKSRALAALSRGRVCMLCERINVLSRPSNAGQLERHASSHLSRGHCMRRCGSYGCPCLREGEMLSTSCGAAAVTRGGREARPEAAASRWLASNARHRRLDASRPLMCRGGPMVTTSAACRGRGIRRQALKMKRQRMRKILK